MRSLLPPFGPTVRRTTAGVLARVLVAAVIAWYFGVNVWHAILLGAAATVISLAAQGVSAETEARALDWGTEARSNRSGARDDVRNLSRSLRAGWGYVGRTAEIQLRQTARRRLLLEGLDLRRPDHRALIERRIGAPAYEILTREKLRGLRLKNLTACLDRLDALEPGYYPAPPPARRRTLNLNPTRRREYRDR
jgi:hypothetical protein